MSHVSRLTSHISRHARFAPSLVTYATVLVAFFLRVYRLADKNVWWDEGWSIWLSQKDLAWIALRTAADEHPPLHYWMLHFWNFIAGTNAFAGRFLSVAFGVLTVALIYRIGKRVGKESLAKVSKPSQGWVIGILAALFLATARFHIWWSQDIKNYTPSIFFAFAAVWFMLDVIERSREAVTKQSPTLQVEIASRKPLAMTIIAYAVCAALAMWTHYLAALVLLALNLYAFFVICHLSLDIRRWHIGTLAHWLIGNLIAALLFAPWLYLYLQNAAAWTAAPAFDFALFLKLVATVLPLGVTTNIDNYAALTIGLTILAALPVFSLLAKRSVFSKRAPNTEHWTLNTVPLFALIVVFPPLLVYALSLTPVAFFAPKIQARYLLILLPAYAILLALGVAFLSRLSRTFAVFAILIVLSANAFVLNDYYAERRLRDEYMTLANTINSFARQGDLVLLDTDQEWPTFLYYLRYPLDWLGASNGKTMNADDAATLVRRALNRNDAVWLVTIPDALATDPQKLLEARLARELPKRFEQTFDDKRLALYAPDDRDLTQVLQTNLNIQHPLPFIRFANPVESIQSVADLVGFDLPVRETRAGDTARLVTYWFGPASRGEILLSDPNGRLAQAAVLEIPGGKNVRVQSDVNIPPDAVGGEYTLRVRVAEKTVELARVSVEPRRTVLQMFAISNRVDYRVGDAIRLAGYDLPLTKFRAGDTLSITLYWRVDRAVEKSYTAFVHLVGAQFNPKQNNPLWGQVDRAPTPPTTAWLANEIVPDAYRVAIDADAPPGKYKVVIGMYDAATGARLSTDTGDSIAVVEIELTR